MNLRPERGGFLRPFGCGWFIREFLLGHGPYDSPKIDPSRGAPIENLRSAYKNALLRAHAEDMVALALEKGIELPLEEALRRIPHRLTKMRSHSFYRYFHHLKMLGWVEPTKSPSISYLLNQSKQRRAKGNGCLLFQMPCKKGDQEPEEGDAEER